ncbi:T9SS type A sorting domain-containing protein [Psychroserpens sp. AS72]|uniref:T9SS type A sorting domain-containing protein n=1 Tax=Psychroserpens sp. AS72 TaxID=3135775 RepID=UPI00317905FB
MSENNGKKDIWIVKLDAFGNLIWEHSYGGSENEKAYDIEQTSDGGYIVIGISESNDFNGITGHNGYEDIVVLKLDSSGVLEWGKFHGSSSYNDRGLSIEQTADGGYIAAGLVGVDGNGFDFWIAKLTNLGEIDSNWANTIYGGQYNDAAHDVTKTSDGGYVAAGFAKYGIPGVGIETDFWIKKFDSNGNVEWDQLLGGTGTDVAQTIYQTSDGGYIVAGTTRSNDGHVTNYHGKSDIWVVKLDNMGDLEWQRALGGSDDEEATSIFQTLDGNYVISGFTESIDGDISYSIASNLVKDFWVIKLDPNGNIIWDKSLGGSIEEYNYSAQQTNDGGYILAGTSNSNDFDVSGSNGYYDFWVVKLDGESLNIDDNNFKSEVSIFPNPTNGKVMVQSNKSIQSIHVFSLLGKCVIVTTNNEINLSGYPTGVYIVEINTEQASLIKRIIEN